MNIAVIAAQGFGRSADTRDKMTTNILQMNCRAASTSKAPPVVILIARICSHVEDTIG
jgi:hypothetical protein